LSTVVLPAGAFNVGVVDLWKTHRPTLKGQNASNHVRGTMSLSLLFDEGGSHVDIVFVPAPICRISRLPF
jgi:hypothetical protein